MIALVFFFFKQKTAYEMRISDWSSDVCSSDLPVLAAPLGGNSGGERLIAGRLPGVMGRIVLREQRERHAQGGERGGGNENSAHCGNSSCRTLLRSGGILGASHLMTSADELPI